MNTNTQSLETPRETHERYVAEAAQHLEDKEGGEPRFSQRPLRKVYNWDDLPKNTTHELPGNTV